jgi:hypothetical protein
LTLVLDAFGDDPQAEVGGERDDRARDRIGLVELGDEDPIDLDDVDGE